MDTSRWRACKTKSKEIYKSLFHRCYYFKHQIRLSTTKHVILLQIVKVDGKYPVGGVGDNKGILCQKFYVLDFLGIFLYFFITWHMIDFPEHKR